MGPEAREQIKDLMAGTMGGLTSKVIEYPFDTVKVARIRMFFHAREAVSDSKRGIGGCGYGFAYIY
eukprot:774663-Amorphochlora_amoeboformis.AAC.1